MKISFANIIVTLFAFILISALVLLVVTLSNPEHRFCSEKDGVVKEKEVIAIEKINSEESMRNVRPGRKLNVVESIEFKELSS